MTACDEGVIHSSESCSCESCCTADLPANPFLALRTAYGMLLGEDDFRTLMGNPRGKQMVHSAWLHRSGVVWGYRVYVEGEHTLKVSPGLAIDPQGREVATETTLCLNVRDWLATQKLPAPKKNPAEPGSHTRTVEACLLVRFDCCQTTPVPTLADPCDITRKHDDYSRIVERAKLELRLGSCPPVKWPYHRIRVLLGLDEVLPGDHQGDEALAARREVATAPPDRRARELLKRFRALAACDVVDLHPAREPGDAYPTWFPSEDGTVVLASVKIGVHENGDYVEIVDIHPDYTARTALLPTSTIQELSCALAPGLINADVSVDAGGPRVDADSRELSHEGRRLSIAVTAPLNPGSLRRAVRLTSLSIRGWVDEDIDAVRYDADDQRIVIELADRPINEIVRLTVRGTGPTPVFGLAPAVPLAGLVGGPPGTSHDGHDAVLTFENPLSGRSAES
ncbi:MAG: hypothetical protein ACRDRB_02585 [Pseudonocardiaceae bacterium]